ncbi:GPW/gp25 family protein [Pantoea sp. SORGH_AS_0659]|uniref:GPW/gp25 family protein n=1 Tax=unclassified Pantoea TaxID=2630326 RepID=UPI00285CD341|nr:GPW/gp25 family protein [Pantoea sp. SORGH_AS_0659]MDR6348527.1 phage baseplate assembly protein W [Pantoea sp. SORGH_AS_0659]
MSTGWKGMNSADGAVLDDEAHLHQSVNNILLTPAGSRVMRRDYGSSIFSLIDQPDNAVTRLKLMSAACIALWRWEPRLTPVAVTVETTEQGAVQMIVKSRRSDTSSTITTDITLKEGQ